MNIADITRFCTMRRCIRAQHCYRCYATYTATLQFCRPTCSPDTRLSNRLPAYTARTCFSNINRVLHERSILRTCWISTGFYDTEDRPNSSSEKGTSLTPSVLVIEIPDQSCDERETARDRDDGTKREQCRNRNWWNGIVLKTYSFERISSVTVRDSFLAIRYY